jgi:hypothetical protein
VPRPTQGSSGFLPVRGCHPLWPAFPGSSGCHQTTTGLVRFRSPLLAESLLMSFPPGTEMFQFPGFASAAYGFSAGSSATEGVAPFGDVRINACSRLPEPFRNVLRPSSPLSAKASTKCPLHTLDLELPCTGPASAAGPAPGYRCFLSRSPGTPAPANGRSGPPGPLGHTLFTCPTPQGHRHRPLKGDRNLTKHRRPASRRATDRLFFSQNRPPEPSAPAAWWR